LRRLGWGVMGTRSRWRRRFFCVGGGTGRGVLFFVGQDYFAGFYCKYLVLETRSNIRLLDKRSLQYLDF